MSRQGLLAAGLLLSFMLLGTACSTATRWGQPTPEQASNSPKVTRSDGQPPKSARGNPAFYEVFGKRYHVMPTSGGYTERGVASWYGNKFHGKPTSSGTPYDMHAMTAAHKTLPLPTRVRVTNLSNGRSVVVLVNDRGPFVDNRIIDMSYAAAHKLDMVRNGTAMVEVTAYPYDRPVAPAPQAPVLAETKPDGFSLPSPIATAEAAAPRAGRGAHGKSVPAGRRFRRSRKCRAPEGSPGGQWFAERRYSCRQGRRDGDVPGATRADWRCLRVRPTGQARNRTGCQKSNPDQRRGCGIFVAAAGRLGPSIQILKPFTEPECQ